MSKEGTAPTPVQPTLIQLLSAALEDTTAPPSGIPWPGWKKMTDKERREELKRIIQDALDIIADTDCFDDPYPSRSPPPPPPSYTQ
jgi:hypothetical protein